ncbi:hypothetical protein I6A60_34965 [Frankia sp. AgB1.9]|uniref:hypothetical protein n=1 Tax=unclassified Frankia TaxID=2632575 RepID=UPI0019330D2E|nr:MULTISPECIES: hypothetical protein [unclassified Frankia]MBL7493699.1 hypothetical protein [Frankia sp. AgW1.1]MBL7553016.1 hypothetical protein [Frankia sp. AgB1.9]MBL7621592.1 hypothetical protein [Frankia sp. AgB1.8]
MGPEDAFLRILGPSDAVAELVDRLRASGWAGWEPAGAGAGQVAPLAQLVSALRDRGVLYDDAAAPGASVPSGIAPPVLHVAGDGPVAHLAAALAAGWAQVRRGPVDQAAVRHADVLMACAGWLPDGHWRQVEQWCARHGTAWTRCHAEGLALFAGPLTVAGRTASYADLRGRRLAAADAPDELLALWAWLDRPDQDHPEVPWPGRGVVAVAAGLLLAEIERWWATGQLPRVDVQLEVGSDGTVTRHPVLPLPVLVDSARSDEGGVAAGPAPAVRA